MSYTSTLVALGSVPTVWGSIVKFFSVLDSKLPSDSKQAIANWLTNPQNKARETDWSTIYPSLIDYLFGSDPISFKFFIRACIASIIAFAVVVVLYAWATKANPDAVIEGWFFLAFVAVNLIPDYVSLLISRLVVLKLAQRPTTARATALLLFHIVLTLASATIVIFVVAGLLHTLGDDRNPWLEAARSTSSFYHDRPVPFRSSSGTPYGIFFYTSFFASMWVWLYLAGGVIIKWGPKTARFRALLVKVVEVKDHPLVAIGWVVASMAAFLLAVFLLITRALGEGTAM